MQRCRLAGAGVNCRNPVTRETENEKMHFSFSLFSILDQGFHFQYTGLNITHRSMLALRSTGGALYTVQVTPSLLRLLSLTTFPPCSCVRMSGCRIVGLYLAVSCEARSGNCSQFRSISVKGPGAVTPGAHPIRQGIVTVTLSTEGAVSSPSIHHRPYLRNRKCPPLLSFKL